MDTKAAHGCTVQLPKAEPALLRYEAAQEKASPTNRPSVTAGLRSLISWINCRAPPGLAPRPLTMYKELIERSHRQQAQLLANKSAAIPAMPLSCKGVDCINQGGVTEQYSLTIGGEKSAASRIDRLGLKRCKTTAAGLGIDGDPPMGPAHRQALASQGSRPPNSSPPSPLSAHR